MSDIKTVSTNSAQNAPGAAESATGMSVRPRAGRLALKPMFTSLGLALALLFCGMSLRVTSSYAAQIGGQKSPQKTEKRAAAAPAQKLFASPEEALRALVSAAQAKDKSALEAIFGPDHQKLESGDPVEDNNDLERFAANLGESAKLQKVDNAKATLIVGAEDWPFPIPIVKQGEQWRFDTKAGIEELSNRHIGEHELSAILTCRAYVLAQWEYFTEGDHDDDGLTAYAQKFISTPGRHDGLYWDTAEGERPSPLGVLLAHARAEGYSAGSGQNITGEKNPVAKSDPAANVPRAPYHGYFFKILTRQGPHARGGRFSYVINGKMIAGYALIAYPDKWGSSGVMTFIVNNQGRVYQKNLGPNTAKIAAAITEYDPDPSWMLVNDE
jgi:hypothetical protein